MKAVSQTYHLTRRNGVWSYRRRVPTPLVQIIGKKVIQFSLCTSDLKEAKKRRAAEDLKWSTRFEVAEQGAGDADASAQGGAAVVARSPLSDREVIRLVQDYVEQTDARDRDHLIADPPESEEQKAEMKMDVEISRQILRNRDDPRADEFIYSTVQQILRRAGIPPPDGGVHNGAAFVELVRRGLLELDQRKLARLDDDHRHTFFDQQFSPAHRSDVTFGEIANQLMQMTAEKAAANRTSAKWVDKQRAHVALLTEIVGGSTPVEGVDYDGCLRVRSLLARIPANRSKLYDDLSIDQSIARANEEDKPLLSPFTQERYLATLREILDLAAKKRLIEVNPAVGMKPLKRETVAPGARRRPFAPDQLKQFFDNDFYRACAQHSPPYRSDKIGWRFWLPLICLYMGMRPNEVCQMEIDDVRVTEAGTWYADVTATSDEDNLGGGAKTLKTASSRRRVPVHPELIAIGVLELVEERRKAGAGPRLFPSLKPDSYGNHAWYPLKRFNESFLPKAIELAPRQSFYSFRHNFRDELRRIGAPPDALQALGGWSQGKLTSDDYGDKDNPDYQVQFMKQIAFPGLDLSHLHACTD